MTPAEAEQKVMQLRALAERTTYSHERKTALRIAEDLEKKYKLGPAEPISFSFIKKTKPAAKMTGKGESFSSILRRVIIEEYGESGYQAWKDSV